MTVTVTASRPARTSPIPAPTLPPPSFPRRREPIPNTQPPPKIRRSREGGNPSPTRSRPQKSVVPAKAGTHPQHAATPKHPSFPRRREPIPNTQPPPNIRHSREGGNPSPTRRHAQNNRHSRRREPIPNTQPPPKIRRSRKGGNPSPTRRHAQKSVVPAKAGTHPQHAATPKNPPFPPRREPIPNTQPPPNIRRSRPGGNPSPTRSHAQTSVVPAKAGIHPQPRSRPYNPFTPSSADASAARIEGPAQTSEPAPGSRPQGYGDILGAKIADKSTRGPTMIANVRARYSNGVFTPLEPLDLEEGKEVTLSIDPAPRLSAKERRGTMRSAAGRVEGHPRPRGAAAKHLFRPPGQLPAGTETLDPMPYLLDTVWGIHCLHGAARAVLSTPPGRAGLVGGRVASVK